MSTFTRSTARIADRPIPRSFSSCSECGRMRRVADPDDLMKKAGGLFSKLGSTLRQTTKQVTGLGRGSLRVELDATKVAPGGVLRGRLVLALPEPISAKRLIVTLRARQRVMQVRTSSSGRSASTTHADVYE